MTRENGVQRFVYRSTIGSTKRIERNHAPRYLKPGHFYIMEDIYEKAERLEKENKELRIIIKVAREKLYDVYGNNEQEILKIVRILSRTLRREKEL